MTKIYSSQIVVDSPEGRRSIRGPSQVEQEARDIPWAIGMPSATTATYFCKCIKDLMRDGFYQYAAGKFGRIIYIETYLNDEPIDFGIQP